MGDDLRSIVLPALLEAIEAAAEVAELLIPGRLEGGRGRERVGRRAQRRT
ncbi:MAG: hypothetical protein H6710_10530 [Myxococcales bacterium]|nr:hypothetical protein [Myxococcales bacterium]